MTQLVPIISDGNLYLSGFIVSTLTNTEITVGHGQCRDDSNKFDIVSPINLIIDFSTNGPNGIDEGSIQASNSYDIYIIADAAGYLPVASVAVLSGRLPVMPTDPLTGGLYNLKRLVGHIVTNASAHIVPYIMSGFRGNKFVEYNVPIQVLTAGAAATFTPIDLFPAVPFATTFILLSGQTAGAGTAACRYTGNTDATIALAPWRLAGSAGGVAIPGQLLRAGQINISLNPGIDYVVAGTTLDLFITGYVEFL